MLDGLPQDLANRWKRGEKARALEYLERQPELRRNLVIYKLLVQEELKQIHQSGLTIDTEQLVHDYPECRDTILNFDPQFQTLAAAPDDQDATQLGQTKALDQPVKTSRSIHPEIPGFEILSELGRGGMGIVYRARQISANRLVALKVVRNEVLETADLQTRANALERFRTEAKAAASLQHDNIISVYEVGEVPSKRPGKAPLRYFAMRFVQGTSLFDMLRKGPLENRAAAKYVMQIARALQAAHDQGILHRDMKPHNVMVETSTDRPLVADFGLAKFVHSDNSITYAGQIMGTPSYMSPEQAQDASRVRASADQYSLGATLYHLLAGHPPFAAPTVQETIRQILEKPPVGLTQTNPSVDRDLETICMKAIEKESSKRYGSCQELADDLQRYLDGVPIVARPVSALERAWRWARRNRALAALMATAAILALCTLGAIAIGYRQTTQALAVSQSRLDKALQVVDDLFTQVSEDELLDQPGLQKLRTTLLQKALSHYEYFLAESKKQASNTDTQILEEIGKANFRFGMVQKLLGQSDVAREAYNEARNLQERLVKQSPEDIGRIEALTDTLNAIGSLASQSEDYTNALDAFEQSHRYRLELVAKDPSQLKYQRLACNTLMNIGLAKFSLGRIEEGMADWVQSQDQRQSLLERFGPSEKLQKDIARGWYNMTKYANTIKDPKQTKKYSALAVDSYSKAIELNPKSQSNQSECTLALLILGEASAELGEDQEAVNSFQEAQRIATKLAESNPDVMEYQADWAILEKSLGEVYFRLEKWDLSQKSWEKALEITRKLQSLSPESMVLLDDLMTCLCSLGELSERSGQVESAIEYRRESLKGLEKLSQDRKDDPWYKEQLDLNRAWLLENDSDH